MTREFWSHFIEQHWQQQPLVIRQPFEKPLMTPGEMFSAIKNACEQFRAGPLDHFFRFYTEDFGLTGRKLEDYIPRAADLSVTDYGERITRKLNGWRFGLVINQFQARDEWILQRARKFLRPLLVELPNQRCIELVTFVGNYD